MTIRCLIVEDEPLAADILKDYIAKITHLKLVAVCSDAFQAMEYLNSQRIDLLLLDIHLPGLKGLDFLKTLKNPPAVILTTAYHEYALQGYEFSVKDYLLKPIEFTRFVEAINKVSISKTDHLDKGVITIYADKKNCIIALDDITYIESQKEYINVNTLSGCYTSKYALSKIEEELDPRKFWRIHRSFLIAISKIQSYNAQEITIKDKSIPIGGNYREEILEKLKQLFGTTQH
ncbi:DNA-binding response regulator [Chryseotalea sanaruensis]|uniref:DNA-binding response regulator n=1 Tax=Chryseotalea sanaruensis TaxID=2482724 RepID=A0A401U544_9BACT|nr:LytTR family DNA-binding domain-containing protein [Chryseotalea sanaruensis]GCC50084.1 DNA-binding response regulator [Chryseotalea sanaruensis]